MVQATLADMLIATDAARLLIDRAARHNPSGPPDPYETSVAKCFANDTAKRVSDLAMQLHGGYGYSVDYELERYHRDAHGWALAGGTGHMQRIRIVSQHLGRSFDQRARSTAADLAALPRESSGTGVSPHDQNTKAVKT
jgi:butyryl-CoA dehydrogenase